MSKFKVVITDHNIPGLELEKEVLASLGKYELVDGNGLEHTQLLVTLQDAHAIMAQYIVLNAETINALRNCKVIAYYGKGLNFVDIEAATKKGIFVTNVPDYCNEEVAVHAWALILNCVRKISFYQKTVYGKGIWNHKPGIPIYRLSNMTLGLLGFGDISKNVARMAAGAGCKIQVYDPYLSEDVCKQHGATKMGLAELLAASDVISVHVPLSADTENLIGTKELQMMKSTAYLVNTSRGGIIDEEALYIALKEGRIAGAGLDVLKQEPPSLDNPLFALDNVVVTPHAGFYSEEAYDELRIKTAQQVVSALKGGVPRYLVNRKTIG